MDKKSSLFLGQKYAWENLFHKSDCQYLFQLILEKILLDSKLDFAFVSFSYNLNYLDFFFELMSIFFILFLFRYFVCKDLECNKL